MNYTLDIIDDFSQATSIDELWGIFKRRLANYGVTHVNYGAIHSPALFLQEQENEGFRKSDYPDDYLQYFDTEYEVLEDPTIWHVLEENKPMVWTDTINAEKWNERQRRFMDESAEFGLPYGVTIPLRFGYGGIAGCGLAMTEINEREFDDVWQAKHEEVLILTRLFDAATRHDNMESRFSLAPREIDVLTLLAQGYKTPAIANRLGTASSTVEKQIRSARRKLNARNNEQAVIKALVFNEIKP